MDMKILLMLQEFRNGTGNVLSGFFHGMTYLGSSHILVIFMAVIFWSIDKDFGTYLFMGWNGNRLLNGFFKVTACIYRPWIREPRIIPDSAAKITATGYSFPSGHSTNAASFFGGLLFFCFSGEKKEHSQKRFPAKSRRNPWYKRTGKLLFGICNILLILLVMFSRMYFGVHTLQDVLVGGLFGVLFMYGLKWLYLYLERKPVRDGFVLFGAVFLSAVLCIYACVKTYPEDLDASGKIIVSGSEMAKDTFRAAWCSLSFFISWFIERRWIHFSVCGGKRERIASAALGLFGYFLLESFLFPVVKMFTGSTFGMIFSTFLEMIYTVCVVPVMIQMLLQRKKSERYFSEGKKENRRF